MGCHKEWTDDRWVTCGSLFRMCADFCRDLGSGWSFLIGGFDEVRGVGGEDWISVSGAEAA